MKPTKIQVKIEGMVFELPEKNLRKTDYSGNPITPFIRMNQVSVASLMKQYVKKRYPSVVCSVSSDSYSMGDSVNVYLSDMCGNEVDKDIVKDVDMFSKRFEKGRFNGMEDIYEYRDSDGVTDNGTVIDGGTKYCFVTNRPKFGTVPDVVRMLKDYQAGNYVGGPRDLAGSIKAVMGYGITQASVDKALKLL